MPYFYKKNNKKVINILFIHIPKTGGSSIENYFRDKYKIPLNEKSLCMFIKTLKCSKLNKKISLQHHTLKQIYHCRNTLGIHWDSIKIISVVRNPYDRIISDLYFLKLLKCEKKYTKKEIYNIINKFLNPNNIEIYDNHPLPQYMYLLGLENNIYSEIHILKNENLNEGMKKLGYSNFGNRKENKNKCGKKKINILDDFNNDSIVLINKVYDNDFRYFNYPKIDNIILSRFYKYSINLNNYNKGSISSVYQYYYGIHNNKIDVTEKFEKKFIKNNKIVIKKGVNFNKFFGDPYLNKIKKIFIYYNNNFITYINEYIKKDYILDLSKRFNYY